MSHEEKNEGVKGEVRVALFKDKDEEGIGYMTSSCYDLS